MVSAMLRLQTCLLYAAAISLFVIVVNFAAFTYFWDDIQRYKTVFSDEGMYDIGRENSKQREKRRDSNPGLPVILWWTDFMKNPGSVLSCGDVSCFTTNNRQYKNDPLTKMMMFYGSTLTFDDLPLPRFAHEQWAIIHEESPKNNFAFTNPAFMSLFNHSATFRRRSHYPLTLQWLNSIQALESKEYYRTVEEKNRLSKEEDLAPIAYIHSDCDAPSDRDNLVRMISKYVRVDSLGRCLHNKDLPENLSNPILGMHHSDFYHLLSKYKFVIAAENAICEDYITEKFWRSFYVGTVPIVYGSPSIKDWLPSENSALVVQDYTTVKDLVQKIQDLQNNNAAYSEMLSYKLVGVTNQRLLHAMKTREWAVDGSDLSFFDTYMCTICRHISHPGTNNSLGSHIANIPTSLDCPKPATFDMETESLQDLKTDDDSHMWSRIYIDELYKGDFVLSQIYKNVSAIAVKEINAAVLNRYNIGKV